MMSATGSVLSLNSPALIYRPLKIFTHPLHHKVPSLFLKVFHILFLRFCSVLSIEQIDRNSKEGIRSDYLSLLVLFLEFGNFDSEVDRILTNHTLPCKTNLLF